MTSRNDGGSPATLTEAEAAETPPTDPRPARESVPTLHDVEGAHIRFALQASNWNKRQTARALGISRDTLYRKIAEHGLEPRPDERPACQGPRIPK